MDLGSAGTVSFGLLIGGDDFNDFDFGKGVAKLLFLFFTLLTFFMSGLVSSACT